MLLFLYLKSLLNLSFYLITLHSLFFDNLQFMLYLLLKLMHFMAGFRLIGDSLNGRIYTLLPRPKRVRICNRVSFLRRHSRTVLLSICAPFLSLFNLTLSLLEDWTHSILSHLNLRHLTLYLLHLRLKPYQKCCIDSLLASLLRFRLK